jgi:GrpB-like predicted nucleotidyltransferase (UPF0157 family)
MRDVRHDEEEPTAADRSAARRAAWADQPVTVVSPDPGWASRATTLTHLIAEVLDRWLIAPVEHIGSTAVTGLAAKPIVDLMAGVQLPALEGAADEVLAATGWELVPPELDDRGWRRFFVLPCDARREAHLHLMDPTHPKWADTLAFRDALRRQPLLRRRYAELKHLAADAHRDDREGYTDAKTEFVTAVLRSVGR